MSLRGNTSGHSQCALGGNWKPKQVESFHAEFPLWFPPLSLFKTTSWMKMETGNRGERGNPPYPPHARALERRAREGREKTFPSPPVSSVHPVRGSLSLHVASCTRCCTAVCPCVRAWVLPLRNAPNRDPGTLTTRTNLSFLPHTHARHAPLRAFPNTVPPNHERRNACPRPGSDSNGSKREVSTKIR